MIGRTISHYRIVEKLGEGGMGVVYKAEDTTLKRTVALKFLPGELEAHEPERARFLHEAQAASALNHPHICTIHDLQDYRGEYFIVMEYVDGKTLREIIPIRETADAVAYAIQIAEALHEAHSHGIVHRDVKPENIMVNRKNQIKVMDFGVAKLKGSLKLTKTSSTVGTLAYMAPEQIQGGEVDARSDIFSFGIMLFEMLTGRLPFRGEHQAAMMYSIVNEEPEPIERYMPDASPILANIVQRALEKDPSDRFQSAADMAIELRRLQKKTTRISRALAAEQPMAAPGNAVPGDATAEQTIGRRPFRRVAWIGIGTVVLLGIIAGVYRFLPRQPSTPALNPDMTHRVLPIPHTEVGSPGLSQDGSWAAFPACDVNSKWDVYYMNTASGESRRVTSDSSSGIYNADISPDGGRIVYDRYNAATNRMEIAVVSAVGGSSKLVVDGGMFPQWRPDGERIGYVRAKYSSSQSGKAEFWSVRSDGSENRRELIDSTSSNLTRFAWSPDGRSICWIRYFSPLRREIFVYELPVGKARQVTFDGKAIRGVSWAPNDQIIFASNRSGNFNLWMVPASGGAAVQMTKGAGPDYFMDISRDGSKLVYYQEQNISHIWISGTNGGNPHQITFDDAFLWRVAFSPDGKRIIFGSSRPIGSREVGAVVCSVDRNGGNRRELTSRAEGIGNPIPSPDGRWIVYAGRPADEPQDSMKAYLIDAENPSIPRLICKGCPFRWVDERTFTCLRTDDSTGGTWLNSIEGGEPRKLFEDSTLAFPLQGGRYIGYMDWRSGRIGTWISTAPGFHDPSLPSPKRIAGPSVEYGEFDKSGNYFYYVKNAGELRRISIPSGEEEIIHGVFPGLNPTFDRSSFDISYDGKEIVYTDARSNSRLVMIEHMFK